jgi:hypothetical protein
MPVPLPAPRVPPTFPPRAATAPSVPRIIAAGGPTGCPGGPPYIDAGGQTAPYTEVGGLTAPSGGPTTWGPLPCLLLHLAWVHHRAPGRRH